MADRLFRNAYGDVQRSAIRQALDRVRALPDGAFVSPNLAGTLDKIASESTFTVAALRSEQRSGVRRKEWRKARDYGQMIDIEVSIIDVTIPFTGDPHSFEIAPSQSHVIETPVTIQGGALVASLTDDDALDRNVDDLIKRVGENLDRLRTEAEGLQASVRSQVGAFADQRVAQVKAQKDRDSTRSFPIR